MTVKFQEQVLKYLLQQKEGKRFITLIDNTCFEIASDKIIFDMLKEYVTKFNVLPSKVSLLEWFDRNAKEAKLKEDIKTAMVNRIVVMYEPLSEETNLIRLSIVEFAQRLQTKHLFLENVDKVKEGDEAFFQLLARQMLKIGKLTEANEDEEKNKGGFLLKDHDNFKYDVIKEAKPTDLKGLNKLTAAGGFYSPQLIVLMAAPKGFKTGTMLNIVLGMVRDGLNVYYADTENGIGAIRTRSLQKMLDCEVSELREMKDKAKEVVKWYKKMGGDMEIDFYPARSKTLDDVDENLEYLKAEFGWVPDVIVYDYLDLFEPADKSVKEPRFKIQNVYHHAVRLNNKWGCFAITVSPVGRKAVSKEVIQMSDFAEDFAKAYNCHAAFALCRTDDEILAGIARLVPVAQREGVAFQGDFTTVFLEIDEKRMHIAEIDRIEHSRRLDNALSGRVVAKAEKGAKKPVRNGKKVSDE